MYNYFKIIKKLYIFNYIYTYVYIFYLVPETFYFILNYFKLFNYYLIKL